MILKAILLTVLCGFSSTTNEVVKEDLPTAIIETFQCAEVSKIAPYLDDEVSLKIEDKHYRGDRVEVVNYLAEFFSEKTVESFKIKHSSTRDESGFFIGSLNTKGARYRINCFFRMEKDKLYIHQIRIDNAND